MDGGNGQREVDVDVGAVIDRLARQLAQAHVDLAVQTVRAEQAEAAVATWRAKAATLERLAENKLEEADV